MPEIHANDNGTLRKIARAFVNDNGTLRELREAYVNDNGTLRKVFQKAIVAFTGTTGVGNGPGGTFVELEIRADGTIWRIADGLGNAQLGTWIDPTSAAALEDYKVRFTQVSGTAPEVGVLNADLDLGSNQSIGYAAPATGESGVFTVSIKLGGVVLAGEDYTITN